VANIPVGVGWSEMKPVKICGQLGSLQVLRLGGYLRALGLCQSPDHEAQLEWKLFEACEHAERRG
jgi:hypothetical protein